MVGKQQSEEAHGEEKSKFLKELTISNFGIFPYQKREADYFKIEFNVPDGKTPGFGLTVIFSNNEEQRLKIKNAVIKKCKESGSRLYFNGTNFLYVSNAGGYTSLPYKFAKQYHQYSDYKNSDIAIYSYLINGGKHDIIHYDLSGSEEDVLTPHFLLPFFFTSETKPFEFKFTGDDIDVCLAEDECFEGGNNNFEKWRRIAKQFEKFSDKRQMVFITKTPDLINEFFNTIKVSNVYFANEILTELLLEKFSVEELNHVVFDRPTQTYCVQLFEEIQKRYIKIPEQYIKNPKRRAKIIDKFFQEATEKIHIDDMPYGKIRNNIVHSSESVEVDMETVGKGIKNLHTFLKYIKTHPEQYPEIKKEDKD